MSYRDDRDALREHAESLEQELSAARAEIERLRRGEVEPGLRPLAASGGDVLAATSALLLLLGALAPAPRAARVASIALGLTLALLATLVAHLIVLARANELIVLSGGARGVRKIRTGRALRMPLLERASRLDLGVFRLSFSVEGARTKDGALVDVHLLAHCRVNQAEQALDRAVAQLHETPSQARSELVTTALTPAVRRAVGAHDQTELGTQRARVSAAIRGEAQTDLDPLGLLVVSVYLLEIDTRGAPR
jgi:uncharacterized membrane protein YqiK